jgi:hypothetical protein
MFILINKIPSSIEKTLYNEKNQAFLVRIDKKMLTTTFNPLMSSKTPGIRINKLSKAFASNRSLL